MEQENKGFQCKRCGECCIGEGFVRASEDEIRAMADYLKMELDQFKKDYTRPSLFGDYWLKEKEHGDCIFLEENGCRIHNVKPLQCKTFPMNWRNRDSAQICPGLK